MSGDFSLHDAIAGSDWPCAPTRALSQPTLPFKLSRGPDMHSAHSFVRCAALADGLPAATPEARPGLVFSSLRCLVLTWLLLRTGAFHLACVMGQCRKIEALELGGNNLGKEGGWLVAGALAGCPQLRTMDLEGNNIGDQGASRLAGVLGCCSSLTRLNLSMNDIGSEATMQIAREMHHCRALVDSHPYQLCAMSGTERVCCCQTNLDLSFNAMGQQASLCLLEAAKGCESLLSLRIAGNKRGTGSMRLAELQGLVPALKVEVR